MDNQKNKIYSKPKQKKRTVPLVIGCILAIVTIVSAPVFLNQQRLCCEKYGQSCGEVCWAVLGLILVTLPLLIESVFFIIIGILYFKNICKHPYWWLFLLNIFLLIFICLFFAQR